MALWRFSLREIRSRPGRAILTLLSVVIGVATVVSVSVATSTTRRVFADMYTTLTGRAALEITARGGGSFDQTIMDRIAKLPGVAAAAPLVRRDGIMYLHRQEGKDVEHRSHIQVTIMGIDPEKDQAVRDYELVTGHWLDAKAKVLVDSSFARNFDLQVGDKVKFLGARGLFTVVGLVSPRGASAVGMGVVYMNLQVAQDRLQNVEPGQIDSLQIVVRDGSDPAQVQSAVKAILPKGLEVRPPATRTQQGEEILLSSNQALLLATGFSWLLAFFIVLNTFQMNVAERRRQLAIMRAIGATRGQIMRMVCREGLGMGIVGTVLGIGLGLGGALLLSRATARLLQTGIPPIQVGWGPLVLAAVAGPAISLIGVLYPAWRAGRLSPLEGMGAVLPTDLESPPWTVSAIGLLMFSGGGSLLAASILSYVPATISLFFGYLLLNTSVFAALLMLIGFVFLIPVALGPLSRAVACALSPLLRVEGRLAEGQVVRRRGRTTLTVGVLFLALTFGIGLGNAIVNNVNDVRNWYQNTIRGDYFVRAMMPSMTSGRAADLPAEMGPEIRAIPGIASVKTASFVPTDVGGQGVIAIVTDFNGPDRRQFDLTEGDPRQVHQQLAEGQVIIGTVLAQRNKWHVGSEIPLQTRAGKKMIRVAGLTNEYTAGGLTMYMERKVAERLLNIPGVSVYIIKAVPGKVAEVGQALKRLCQEHGVLLQSYAELIGMIDGMMAGVVAALWGLLALVFMVSAFGVVNTLTMNVIEQTRELGLLRIVAMTRRQVRKLILSQAALLASLGLAPGVLSGLGVAYLMNLALRPVSGHPIAFAVHPLLMAACFVVAFSIVLTAAWFPAARAARLELVEALQYQ